MLRGTVKFKGEYCTSVETSLGEKDVCVFHFLSVPPDPTSWDSDYDYYGYEEIDWEFIDTHIWRNLSKNEINEIENILIPEMQKCVREQEYDQ